jgi:putative DNA primase/helicase
MGKRTKLPQFVRTDAGNAELFAFISKDDRRYDHKRRCWLIWRKHWWVEDSDGLIMRTAKSVARMRLEAAASLSGEENEAEIKWAMETQSRARLEAMIELAKSEYPIFDSGEGWDSDPMLLGVANGVIDLRAGTLRDGRPEDKITLHTDIPFIPSAQCPRFIQFLEEIFGNGTDLIEYIQRVVGYSLTGDVTEQCLFLCFGSGANGKSTFLELLKFILGPYAYNLPFSAFELSARASIPNDVAAIASKRLVTAVETSESAKWNEARIKGLTGGDEITARHLYHEFFRFNPTGKFFLAVNHLPEVADESEGFWRRIRIIPFLKQFSASSGTADKDLLAKLKAEAPGILVWAVQGCLEWQKSKLGIPPAIREATTEYREDSDPLADFIEERCLVGPKESVEARAIWDAYYGWAIENLDRAVPDRKGFSRRLQVKGFKKDRVGKNRTWTWFGIGLRSSGGSYQPPLQTTPARRTDADVRIPIVVT